MPAIIYISLVPVLTQRILISFKAMLKNFIFLFINDLPNPGCLLNGVHSHTVSQQAEVHATGVQYPWGLHCPLAGLGPCYWWY